MVIVLPLNCSVAVRTESAYSTTSTRKSRDGEVSTTWEGSGCISGVTQSYKRALYWDMKTHFTLDTASITLSEMAASASCFLCKGLK